ncbi:hypothetical protein [Mesorhizobium sp. Z1-4]|uniref:hypothetical protein n=1 Tax=Mesorhizobium sp. Z1-4 TaxID=2448478 RepID=UPI000FD80620|nr:hypothetical protein [Mesorhizobium sp. Z1-4]
MRLVFATILMAFGATNAANASSFVVLDPLEKTESPSIIVLGKPESGSFTAAGEPRHAAIPMPSFERFGGAPAAEPKFITVSPSVIAMVDAPQPIAMENVASIGDPGRRKRSPHTLPMVIRGGIVGDAFATRSAPSVPVYSEQPQQEVSSAPRSPSPRQAPRAPEPPSPDQLPKSALPPPAPPTGRME